MAEDFDDQALIRRITAGDRQAMRSFYERYSGPLQKFVALRLADSFEAADIVQEAMLEVWRNADRFEGRSSVKSWLFNIARNKAVDRIRQKSRAPLGDPDMEAPDEAPDPLAVTQALQEAAQLKACMAELRAEHRAVLHLAFFQDLAYAEIAEIEGCPVGTVKTRIHHAKKLLMHCLAKSRTG